MSDNFDSKSLSDIRREVGRKGGKVKNPLKGFGSNRDLAREAGIKGGRLSKRGKAKGVKHESS